MTRSVEIPEEVGKAARKAAMQRWVTGSSDTTQMLASVNAALAVVADHLAPAGDGGLREALEELVTEYELRAIRAKTDEEGRAYMQARRELRAALAAHPAAPAVPQPAQVRERATEALHRERHFGRTCEEDEPQQCLRYREAWRDVDVLAATGVFAGSAVPQPVDREALLEALKFPGGGCSCERQCRETGAHREHLADAVLAVLAGEQEQVEK